MVHCCIQLAFLYFYCTQVLIWEAGDRRWAQYLSPAAGEQEFPVKGGFRFIYFMRERERDGVEGSGRERGEREGEEEREGEVPKGECD